MKTTTKRNGNGKTCILPDNARAGRSALPSSSSLSGFMWNNGLWLKGLDQKYNKGEQGELLSSAESCNSPPHKETDFDQTRLGLFDISAQLIWCGRWLPRNSEHARAEDESRFVIHAQNKWVWVWLMYDIAAQLTLLAQCFLSVGVFAWVCCLVDSQRHLMPGDKGSPCVWED